MKSSFGDSSSVQNGRRQGNVDYCDLPWELKELEQWVGVNGENKVPMKLWEKKPASTSRPDTWGSWEEVEKQVIFNGRYDHAGFVFTEHDPYVGIDIDKGYDEDGFISALATDIIKCCNSYTERSYSGRGFHVIVKGKLPFKGKNNQNGVEIYQTGRYFLMTGDVLLSFNEIKENQAAIDEILERYFPARTSTSSSYQNKHRQYGPCWSNATGGGKVKLRPSYPDIPEGARNTCLTSLAGLLHNIGYSKKQIIKELAYVNYEACSKPLDIGEIERIANNVTRYRR